MEHFYQNLRGWFDFQKLYLDMIEKASEEDMFVELGTYMGKSAAFMGVELMNREKTIFFETVDKFEIDKSWPGYAGDMAIAKQLGFDSLYELAKHILKPVDTKVFIMKGDSAEFAELHKDKAIQFVFVDACHTYEAVKKDILAWLPKIKPGGYIGGHDYSSHIGVGKAVLEIFNKESVDLSYPNCWLVKR